MTEPSLLDTFKGRLRLEGVLTTHTGLHIGAGGSGDPLATDSPVVRNGAGAPFIPGASLKGVIRSAAEGLLRDTKPRGDAKEKLWTCDFLIGDPCVHHEQVRSLREDHQKWLDNKYQDEIRDEKARKRRVTSEAQRATARDIWKESCTVCRLFGSLALASRVRFPDLPLHGGVPMMEIRNGVGIDRDRELAAPGVLYDFEAVPPGTEFELTVILDNYSEAEVGLVLWLFDQLDQGNLALGGKTSRGLGQVRVEWRHILETRLNGANPFAMMLSTQDLLLSDRDLLQSDTGSEKAEEPELRLPTSGDAEAWKKLASIIQQMPVIDKTELGKRAGEFNLSKDNLNEKLALGLEGRRARKAWDAVLERFVEHGLLVEKNGGYVLAAAEKAEEPAAPAQAPRERDPRLQEVYDRYVGAMARLWQETF